MQLWQQANYFNIVQQVFREYIIGLYLQLTGFKS